MIFTSRSNQKSDESGLIYRHRVDDFSFYSCATILLYNIQELQKGRYDSRHDSKE